MNETEAPRCEVCSVAPGRQGGTLGHLDSDVRLYFCRSHWESPNYWKPITGVVFGALIEARRRAFTPPSKKEIAAAKEKASSNTRGGQA